MSQNSKTPKFILSDFHPIGATAGMLVSLAIHDIETGNANLIKVGVNAFIDGLLKDQEKNKK